MSKRVQETPEAKLVIGLLSVIGAVVLLPFRLLNAGSKRKRPNRGKAEPIDYAKVRGQWKEVGELMQRSGSSHFRMAILQADNIFDAQLKSLGYLGTTFGERLRNAEKSFSPEIYSCVWKAHKIRNRLAHEAEAEVMSWEAREAIACFEQGLRQLTILEDL